MLDKTASPAKQAILNAETCCIQKKNVTAMANAPSAHAIKKCPLDRTTS
jgi:hypothetical protein